MNTHRALSEERAEDQRWVLGAPVLATVDRSVPAEVDPADLALYCTMLGDDALLLAHRLSEWGLRAGLEESAALGEIAHELLGHARVLLGRAAEVSGRPDADRLAYLREPAEFRNVRLAEIDCGPGPGGDFPTTVARLLLFTTWRQAVFEELASSSDAVLATLAARSLAELARHRDHAAQWAIKLGDADGEMTAGLQRVWPLAAELFVPHPVEVRLAEAGCGVDPSRVRARVGQSLDEVLSIARLPAVAHFGALEESGEFARPGGRDGAHTGALEFLLADLQHLARAGLASGRLAQQPSGRAGSVGNAIEDE